MTAATGVGDARAAPPMRRTLVRSDNAWTLGLLSSSDPARASRSSSSRPTARPGIQGLAISVLPLALATVGQAIVVISGGIDLSIGSMMALTSVVAASLMKGQREEFGDRRRDRRPRCSGIAPRRDQRQPGRASPGCRTSS